MTDKTIDQADAVTSVTGNETMPASVGGAAKKVTAEQIKSYVVAAMAGLVDADSFGEEAGDRVMVKTNGVNKHYSFASFADAVFDAFMGKGATDALADTDKISILSGDEEKTVTVGDIKTYISTAFTGNMDIHGLTAADDAQTGDELAAYQTRSGEGGNKKVTVAQIAVPVCAAIPTQATASTTAIADTDGILIARASATAGGTPTLERVPLQNAGIKSTGDVKGPQTTTVNKIPQWNSTTKELKDGLTLTTGIGSGSLDTEIPTALAVKTAVAAAADGKVISTAQSSSTGKLVEWTGTDGKTIGGGYFVTEELTAQTTASNDFIPTAKAVKDAIPSGAITASNTPQAGAIAVFPTAGSNVVDAQALTKVTSVRAEGSAVDTAIPTEKAVSDALYTVPSWTRSVGIDKYMDWNYNHQGKIFIGGVGINTFREGGGIENTLSNVDSNPSSNSFVTTSILNQYRQLWSPEKVETAPSDGAYGYVTMKMLYCTSNQMLYINIGTKNSALWKSIQTN